ncbi:MAG: hypothetical protein Q7L55_03750 [Actinomycetota bacterium]|nr:hypothetical protein [Actinomycetota bacterium]
MQMSIANNKQQLLRMKSQLRKLELGKTKLEGETIKRQKEIDKLQRELWDYEASHSTLSQAKLKTWRTVTIGDKTLTQYEESITRGDGNYKLSSSLGIELFRKLPTLKSDQIVLRQRTLAMALMGRAPGKRRCECGD